MRVLVVENMIHSDLGQVGVALGEAGAEIDLRRPFTGEALPADIHAHDALVVLGGEQSAIDDHVHPYLPQLARLMRAFADADKAVLGICLGSQLLARAHGAENLLGQTCEFGWHDVALTAAGEGDPVLNAAGTSFPIFEWHADTFTLPAGAVRLATNPAVANQAFRIGRAAYGMQFHFEAGTRVVEDWNRIFEDQIMGIDPHWLERYPEHAARHAEQADAAGLALARAWVRTIRSVEMDGSEARKLAAASA
jgi:GMP synthase (glutamine-hydrolysing)